MKKLFSKLFKPKTPPYTHIPWEVSAERWERMHAERKKQAVSDLVR